MFLQNYLITVVRITKEFIGLLCAEGTMQLNSDEALDKILRDIEHSNPLVYSLNAKRVRDLQNKKGNLSNTQR